MQQSVKLHAFSQVKTNQNKLETNLKTKWNIVLTPSAVNQIQLQSEMQSNSCVMATQLE